MKKKNTKNIPQIEILKERKFNYSTKSLNRTKITKFTKQIKKYYFLKIKLHKPKTKIQHRKRETINCV